MWKCKECGREVKVIGELVLTCEIFLDKEKTVVEDYDDSEMEIDMNKFKIKEAFCECGNGIRGNNIEDIAEWEE